MNARTTTVSLLVALVVLAGCTNDPDPVTTSTAPTTTATPEPATEAPPDPRRADEAEAVAAYEHYFEVMNEVDQRPGAQGWRTDLLPLTGGDHAAELVNLYTQLEAQGLRTTTPAKLISITPTEYVLDSTGHEHQQVLFDVCIDATGFEQVFPDGTDTGSWGMRGIVKVKMQHVGHVPGYGPDDPAYVVDEWLVASSVTQEGSTC